MGIKKENKFTRENLLSVIQTLNNPSLIPSKFLNRNALKTERALVTKNLTSFPKKASSEKALGYCSDFVSAEDQLSLKATGEL